jgi:RsiW-degrading membrane proteinase PrsW (M82 family)
MLTAGGMLAALSLAGVLVVTLILLCEAAVFLSTLGQSARRVVSESWRHPSARDGAGVAFVAGIVLFVPVIAWIQVPLQRVVQGWVVATLSTADLAVLGLPAALLSGFVQEPAKLLAAMLGLMIGRRWRRGQRVTPEPIGDALLYGAVAGAGFGAFEAAIVLSFSLAAAPVAGLGAVAPAIVERVFAIVFHASLTGIVVYAWSHRRVWLGLTTAILVHGKGNYIALVLANRLGLSGVWVIEAVVAVIALALGAVLISLVRRAARTA